MLCPQEVITALRTAGEERGVIVAQDGVPIGIPLAVTHLDSYSLIRFDRDLARKSRNAGTWVLDLGNLPERGLIFVAPLNGIKAQYRIITGVGAYRNLLTIETTHAIQWGSNV